MQNSRLSSWFVVLGLWAFLGCVFLAVWESGFRAGRLPQPVGVVPVVVSSGAAAMPTLTLTPHSCKVAATVPVPGAAAHDAVQWSFASDPGKVRGYGYGLTVQSWADAGTVNFALCNITGYSITPDALGRIQWRVVR